MDQVIAPDLPAALRTFIRDDCHLPASAFHPLAPDRVPQPARRLLVHLDDMTSTLASFHESPLRVEILRRLVLPELYIREVFLRATTDDAIVEYGVIGIALEQFSVAQQDAITTGQAPLGALLHRFQLPFVSSPICFFSISATALAATPLKLPSPTTCFGRFNRLSRPSGETLAWILEILPPN